MEYLYRVFAHLWLQPSVLDALNFEEIIKISKVSQFFHYKTRRKSLQEELIGSIQTYVKDPMDNLYAPLRNMLILYRTLKEKPKNVELILTGRYAPKEIIGLADLVTEMKEIKHPMQKGITGRKGIEY